MLDLCYKENHSSLLVKITKLSFYYLMIILFFSLTSCSTIRRDGPPSFNVDVSKIPDAQPKTECRAKYGNMKKYRVLGKEYRVMKSAKNYQEKGIASWYGTKFHKQRTSSGEIYNMLSMTAAHKSLPLPTYVQVTNLKNGRKVIVRVNDRGPFASNRIIDLSYVAAKKLGMIGHGITHVHLKAIEPADLYKHPTVLAEKRMTLKGSQWKNSKMIFPNPIYIQVGAFKNKAYAENIKKRLLPLLTSPIHITHLNHSSKNLYRVKIGPIKDLATANQIKRKLREVGLDSQKRA